MNRRTGPRGHFPCVCFDSKFPVKLVTGTAGRPLCLIPRTRQASWILDIVLAFAISSVRGPFARERLIWLRGIFHEILDTWRSDASVCTTAVWLDLWLGWICVGWMAGAFFGLLGFRVSKLRKYLNAYRIYYVWILVKYVMCKFLEITLCYQRFQESFTL